MTHLYSKSYSRLLEIGESIFVRVVFNLILSSQSPELYLFFPQNEVTAYIKNKYGGWVLS